MFRQALVLVSTLVCISRALVLDEEDMVVWFDDSCRGRMRVGTEVVWEEARELAFSVYWHSCDPSDARGARLFNLLYKTQEEEVKEQMCNMSIHFS